MSLAAYLDLDLAPGGSLASDLYAKAATEATHARLTLNADFKAEESCPAFLTPEMQVWYRSHIVGHRKPALQEIRTRFQSIDLGKGQSADLLESARDRITQRKFSQWMHEREQFFSNGEATALAAELDEKERRYERMKAENGGEEAHTWPKSRLFLILGVLALPEIPLNYESFAKVPGITPAIATVLVFIVALAIATSSHIFGICIRQWGELFGGHVSSTAKNRSRRYLAIGSVIFTFALAMVTWGRSLLFSEQLQRKILIGEALSPSDYVAFGGSVAGNVVIWLLGIYFTYAANSHIPGFGELRSEVEAIKARLLKMYARDLQPRVDRHLNAAQKELAALVTTENRSMRPLPAYGAARTAFEDLCKADNRVLAILEAYRAQLLGEARQRGHKLVFVIEDLTRQSRDLQTEIEVEIFAQKKLVLPYA